MFERQITNRIFAALSDTPVTLINGPRQAGKSTLVQTIADSLLNGQYHTFDDSQQMIIAATNPEGYLSGFSGPLIIDEVQRVPEIFLAIKRLVDRDRQPGKFILTGSANVMLLPKIADSLAGRMEVIPLWPLSQTEILNNAHNFVDLIFSELPLSNKKMTSREDLWARLLIGGYPESIQRKNEDRRRAWFDAYISSILLRDVRDLANIEGLSELPNLLNILASRAGNLLNFSELSRSSKLPQTTLKRYMTLLQTTFLVSLINPWSSNINKRFVKAPKIMLNDTGLLAHLLGANMKSLETQPTLKGQLLENFVFTEIYKQNTWSKTQADIFHFRTHEGLEIDLLLESHDKRLVGIEVKSAETINPKDFSALKQLSELHSKRFYQGILLYTGNKIIPFAKNIFAMPISALFGITS